MVEKLFLLKQLEKTQIISRIYVLFFVAISFVIFNATSFVQIGEDIGGLFGAEGIPLVSAETIYYLKSYGLVFLLGIIGSTPLPKRLMEKIKFVSYLEPIALCILLILVTAYLVDGSFNPFLYFRF